EGIIPVTTAPEREDILAHDKKLDSVVVLGDDVGLGDIELVIVLGGDGTILRAAELARGSSAPLLGVNLGHVGFLAESERAGLAETVHCAVERDYLVEERMTLDVRVKVNTEVVYSRSEERRVGKECRVRWWA